MEVILLENLKNLGQIGDVVKVRRGYARNFLIKFGKALNASKENIKVFITAAGGAAALPGVVAAMTNLPVIGVPIGSSSLKGIDALMSIVQMPPGIPVGCVALDSWGARNSAIYAASILALSDSKINENITKYKNKLKQK